MNSYYLTRGAGNPEGPIEHQALVQLVESGDVSGQDFVFMEGWADWRPVSSIVSVPPPLSTDPAVPVNQEARSQTESIRKIVNSLLTPGETVLAVAAQTLPGVSHDGAVATNRRLLLIRPKLGGLKMSFEDWAWIDVADVHISEGILGTTFSVTARGQRSSLARLCQQLEEDARSGRRAYHLEAIRAGAGQVNVVNRPN